MQYARTEAVESRALDTLPQLYSLAELARWSGESYECWRRRVRRGDIRVINLGRNVRVTRQDLDDYLRRRARGAVDDSVHDDRPAGVGEASRAR